MRLFVDCWRQSLAAIALAAVLGPTSGDGALAAEGEHDAPRVKLEREGGERPEANPARDAERREARKEAAERKSEPRGERQRTRDGDEQREAQARELAQRRAHLLEQAAELNRKLRSLKPDQDADERELKGELHRIASQLRELPQQFPHRERVRARLEDVRAAQRRAREAGRADEAERLEREAHELMRALEQRDADRPAGEQMERRLRHIREAVENLRAAGLDERAESLARDAERLVRGGPAAERGPRPEGARDVPAPGRHLERAVHELHGQVQELRQQMEEIRQHLKALAERR